MDMKIKLWAQHKLTFRKLIRFPFSKIEMKMTKNQKRGTWRSLKQHGSKLMEWFNKHLSPFEEVITRSFHFCWIVLDFCIVGVFHYIQKIRAVQFRSRFNLGISPLHLLSVDSTQKILFEFLPTSRQHSKSFAILYQNVRIKSVYIFV